MRESVSGRSLVFFFCLFFVMEMCFFFYTPPPTPKHPSQPLHINLPHLICPPSFFFFLLTISTTSLDRACPRHMERGDYLSFSLRRKSITILELNSSLEAAVGIVQTSGGQRGH